MTARGKPDDFSHARPVAAQTTPAPRRVKPVDGKTPTANQRSELSRPNPRRQTACNPEKQNPSARRHFFIVRT
jgi:hypothetical protein